MRIRLERAFITTRSGTRVINPRPESRIVEAPSLRAAILDFIAAEQGRLLGTITEVTEARAVATAWANEQLYVIAAEPAAD